MTSTTIPEFVDTYSDDIAFLMDGRKALLTHPLKKVPHELCDASFCRMLAVIMTGNVETMLAEWKERDRFGILDRWFADKATNAQRVETLYDGFEKAGIKVDKEVLDDFLAIKYLRNVVSHGRWKPDEKQWLEHRGFPTDTRKLTGEHWNRMLSVNQNMMLYIALTGNLDPSNPRPNELVGRIELPDEDTSGILRKKDFPSIYWNSLERISVLLRSDVEKAVIVNEYCWWKGLSREEIETLSFEGRWKRYYHAARRAGADGFPLIAGRRDLAREALDLWKEYCRLTFDSVNVSQQDFKTATKILSALHYRKIYPQGPFPLSKETPFEVMRRIVRCMLGAFEPLEDEIIHALAIGEAVHKLMLNMTPVILFLELCPVIDAERIPGYLEEGDKALDAMELSDYWYSYVESRQSPNVGRWNFYRQYVVREFWRKLM